jgi:hypothetical protein
MFWFRYLVVVVDTRVLSPAASSCLHYVIYCCLHYRLSLIFAINVRQPCWMSQSGQISCRYSYSIVSQLAIDETIQIKQIYRYFAANRNFSATFSGDNAENICIHTRLEIRHCVCVFFGKSIISTKVNWNIFGMFWIAVCRKKIIKNNLFRSDW